jgi:hypothetical protein
MTQDNNNEHKPDRSIRPHDTAIDISDALRRRFDRHRWQAITAGMPFASVLPAKPESLPPGSRCLSDGP